MENNYSNECCLNCKYLDYSCIKNEVQCLKTGELIEHNLKIICSDFLNKNK